MGMAAILFNDAEPLKKKCQYHLDRRPHVKSSENCQAVSEKKISKDYTLLYRIYILARRCVCVGVGGGGGERGRGGQTATPSPYANPSPVNNILKVTK